MTPLERSRFAADVDAVATANSTPTRFGLLDSARQLIDSARANIRAHHGWTSGIADCLLDLKSCCAVIWCQACVTGQLAERVWRTRHLCALVASVLSVCAVGSFVTNWMPAPCNPQHDVEYSYDDEYAACVDAYQISAWYVTASIMGFIFCLATCVITALIRAHVRKRDNIPATVCEGADDYFCACCCLPCTQCQLIRHELGRSSADRYRLLSSDCSADGAMLV